jgi:hypothetical protein
MRFEIPSIGSAVNKALTVGLTNLAWQPFHPINTCIPDALPCWSMSGSTVIVEPDSVGAWLGLVGVVAGVVVTTAANWFQRNQHERTERQHELDAATGRVIAAATSVLILVQRDNSRAFMPGSEVQADLAGQAEWAAKITEAIERLQVADQVVQRYGKRKVADASGQVVSAATDLARGIGDGVPKIDDAIDSFSRVLRE